MRSAAALFDDYAANHRTPGNKFCHRIGIPLIVFSAIGLLERVVLFHVDQIGVDLALLLIIPIAVYYLRLQWKLGILMLIVFALCYAGGSMIAPLLLWGMFVAGWILQFIGHGVYEKRQPAFLHNMLHLLIGPMWIVNDLLRVVPRSQSPEGV